MSKLKIGNRIKEKRRERNLTQEELASMLGVTKAAVSKWENEESYPDITLLPQIAQLFHMTMDYLFDFAPNDKPLVVVNEYHFGLSLETVDKRILVTASRRNAALTRSATHGRYAFILYLRVKTFRIYCKNT